jgi:cytochrome c biogenesis protein CcdA
LAFPALFALGTALPLLMFASLLATGGVSTGQFLKGARRLDTAVSRVTGAVFVLLGLNEIVLYWLS